MNAPIRIVLDTTAIIAYAEMSLAVGEVMTEVGEENALVALPMACLVEAYQHIIPEDQLPVVQVLVAHPSTVIVDTDPADWLDLAGLARDLGRTDAAAALLLALHADGYVLSREPAMYDGFRDEAPVIPI